MTPKVQRLSDRWRLQARLGRVWLPSVAIATVAVAASIAGLGNDFAQDDTGLILNHPRIHSLTNFWAIVGEPYWPGPFTRDLYRPLALLTLAFQWAVADGAPIVFRMVSYLLYALVSVGVYKLGRCLLPAGAAFGIAMFFAAHPVHVEAVALGVNQGELWVALLSILIVWDYLRIRQGGRPGSRDWARWAALYFTACLFKEHAVVLPGFLLAAESTLLSSPGLAVRVRRVLPGLALLGAVGVCFLALRTAIIDDFVGSFTAEALRGQGPWGRTLTMLQVVPEWGRLLVWPAHLQGDYSPSVINQADGWSWPQTTGLAILGGLAWVGWATRAATPVATFGLLWVAVALFPVTNILIPSGIVLAERTLFLPSIGFLLTAGALAQGLLRSASSQRLRIPSLLAVAGVILVLAGIARSNLRHQDWRNHSFFWSRTVQDAPQSYRAHHAFAQILWDLDLKNAAVTGYRTAFALYPPSWWIRNELANRFRLEGHCHPARTLYEESLEIEPKQQSARASLIACLLYLGEYDSAIAEANAAIVGGADESLFGRYREVAEDAARRSAPPETVLLVVQAASETP